MPSNAWSKRDSFPPTQIRLTRSNKSEPRPLLEDIDENPLTYFLTPGDMDDDIGDDFHADDMLFDAGIEDAHKPREIVRSVSPSSVDGLSKLRAKAVSPDFDSDAITTDEEDDEDYIRFSPPTASFLSPFRGLSAESFMLRSKSPPMGRTAAKVSLTPAASFPAPSSPSRGRPRQALTRSYSVGTKRPYRARRLWREPSPDVWSISEETEEDLIIETSLSAVKPASAKELQEGRQVASAKPKKKVRFLLPPKE